VVDREAFGLTAQKPSEMVAGLDEVAKRAEQLEAREEAKRKAGGRMSANVAVKVDEVGSRWKRWVNIGIVAAVTLVLTALALMLYSSSHAKLDPREGNAEAHKMLQALASLASSPSFFTEGETITAEKARERLKEAVEAQYNEVLERIKPKPNGGPFQRPDPGLVKDREWLEKLRSFKDAWGQPFVFEIEGETLKISAIGKKTAAATPPEPVIVPLRKVPAATKKGTQ